MEPIDVAGLILCVVVSGFSFVVVLMAVRVFLSVRREIREVSQWLDDLEKQRKNPKPNDYDDDEYEPDDYADIDPEADTVEFTPLPPDATPPASRSSSN